MNKLARNTLALGTATVIVTAAVSFSANGADATKSYSTGRFLTGSIGGTNLDSLAQVRGVSAANPGNPTPNTNPLDVTALSSLPINIPGGLDLNLAKFLSASGSAGAINQYAAAPSTGSATGASGLVNNSGAVLNPSSQTPPSDARVTLLDGPLTGATQNLANVDLLLGALSSTTTADKGNPSRDYQIAGLNLELNVPVLTTLVGALTTANTPLTAPNVDDITLDASAVCSAAGGTVQVGADALIGVLNTLSPTLGDGVKLILDGLGTSGLDPVNLCDTGLIGTLGLTSQLDDLISVQVTGLGGLLDGLKDVSTGGIDVDLTGADAGTIRLNLEKILDLNNLPANTDVLSLLTNDLVGGRISTLVKSITDDIAAKIAGVDATATLAGTEVPLTLGQLTDPVSTGLVSLLDGLQDVVDAAGANLDPALNQLVPNLKQLVELTANNQSQSKTPTLSTGTVNAGSTKGSISAAAVGDYYRTSALKINVLSSTLNIDLAASEAATLAADPPVDGAVAAADDSDAPADNGDGSDSVSDGADANADNGDDSDTVADADAQADADVTTALPSTGAPNLLPFWLLGIALLLFGGAVLLNEKRRLNQV